MATSQFSSPLFIGALALFTLLWMVAAWQLPRFWRHTSTFYDVGVRQAYLRARTRTFPTFMAAGFAMLVDGWIFALDPPVHRYGVGLAIVLVVFGSVFACSGIILGPAILLFNRPTWLVPPHLRDDPGYLALRRGAQSRRTARS